MTENGQTKAIQSTRSLTKDKRQKNPISSFDVVVAIIKGNIGTGIFALPLAFNKAGYGVGSLLLLTVAIIAVHCMLLLVSSGQALSKRFEFDALEYGQVSEMAILNLKWEYVNLGCCRVEMAGLGKLFKRIVRIFLTITQFGLSTVYIVFVTGTLQYLVASIPYIEYEIDIRLWILILLVPFVLITYIRDLRTLSPFVTVANLCLLFVVIVIIFDAISRFVTQRAAVNCQQQNYKLDPSHAMICGVSLWPLSVNDLFIFFGLAVFAFEGIAIVMPIENKMAEPQKFKPMLIAGMSTVTCAYFTVGLVGYFAYGECANANLTLDLQSNKIWLKSLYHIAQLYIAFTIYITHALQFYVPMDFIEPPILLKLKLLDTENNKRKKVLRCLVQVAIRTFIVLILCGIALINPSVLGDYISLVGASAMSSLAFVFPALIHLLVFACERHTGIDDGKPPSGTQDIRDSGDGDNVGSKTTLWHHLYLGLWIAKDLFIVLFGVFGAIFGTYATIREIISTFNAPTISKECTGA